MIRKWFLLGSIFISWAGLAQEILVTDVFPDNSYDEIADRITCIEKEVPLVFNQRVKAFIDYFAIKDREYTKGILRKKELYFPLFSKTLARYNLPDELKYLAIVESGLRPNAISRANAVGLWQFISSTGKIYGLHSNWYIDDRMDPVEATDAAARHLKDLYHLFNNWELALAAYNCGPGNVRKAIRRSGYKKDFWKIYRYLPRETRSYVPQFVAITYLLNYPVEHGLKQDSESFRPELDTILISQYFHLETFSNQIGQCVEDVLKWNPQIKRGVLPEGIKNFNLKIPSDWKESITTNRAAIYDSAYKVGKQHLKYLARNAPGSVYGKKKLYYKIKKGDVLGTIAQKYGVRVSDLKKWNRIHGTLIRTGQRLSIWVSPTYHPQTKKLYTTTSSTSSKQPASTHSIKTYTVKNGDSLWRISLNNNTSIEMLKKVNKLQSSMIKTGQQLVIPN